MERLHTTRAEGYASYRCPCCGSLIRTLADEYEDHGCPCGWDITQVSPENNEGDDA